MRMPFTRPGLSRVAGLALALASGAALCGAALAQAPFSVREQGAQQPSGLSAPQQQRLAEEASRVISPNNPNVRRNVREDARQDPATNTTAPGPAPFDVDGDGRGERLVLPEDVSIQSFPATTTSPLANGRGVAAVRALDAVSREQRADLNRLLKQRTDEVRELRVNVDNAQDWVDSVVDRPVVQERTLRLDGEVVSASYNVFLSANEAARGGTLSVAFTNSVLVLPEASRLRVYLNGREVAQTAIDSPDRTKIIALPVSPEVLRAGENALRFEVDQRHRIDCSLDATYELWTRIDTRLTGFSFVGGRIPLSSLADLSAVGVSTNGATRIRVLQRQPGTPANIDRMLRAVQAAAIRGRFTQPLVEVIAPTAQLEAAPGILNVAIGVFDDVRRISRAVPADGAVGPVAALIDPPDIGPTVIITGPNERAVDAALARFDAVPLSTRDISPIAAVPPWLVPGSVRVEADETFTLREAGVETINFSGRRFSTSFNVTLPPDFYAAAYGEATLFLDAAYSGEVEPGSRLSILVNGVLSTSISFTSSTGEIIEDFPIVLVMENFRPGVNLVEILVELETEADQACLPGGTVPTRERFALFSSTRLAFPEFARIGQLPNLASFATNGFPYQSNAEPVRVRVGGTSPDTIGAAGTLMARVAVSRGAALATSVVEEAAPFGASGLIVVAPLSEVPSLVLETTGAARIIPSSWLQPFATSAAGEPEGLERYDEVLRRLRTQLRQDEVRVDRGNVSDGERAADGPIDQRNETERSQQRWYEELETGQGLSGLVSSGWQRLREAVNLDFSLPRSAQEDRLLPPIPDSATLLLAQSQAPDDPDTAWTLVTAPSATLLSSSLAGLSTPGEWRRIGGRVTAYALDTGDVETIAVRNVSYLGTLPLSFSNLRLIAANWFSLNSGVYAISLVLAALILGLFTWFLVRPLGRSND